jgi:hypothetical protein
MGSFHSSLFPSESGNFFFFPVLLLASSVFSLFCKHFVLCSDLFVTPFIKVHALLALITFYCTFDSLLCVQEMLEEKEKQDKAVAKKQKKEKRMQKMIANLQQMSEEAPAEGASNSDSKASTGTAEKKSQKKTEMLS